MPFGYALYHYGEHGGIVSNTTYGSFTMPVRVDQWWMVTVHDSYKAWVDVYHTEINSF
ncbi:hypothetical protein MYX78_12205 [Acidobacteria bacterium AH-259-G07]|nr:hypothetical protein [Acidobacteria bacterium AH-259-G07]